MYFHWFWLIIKAIMFVLLSNFCLWLTIGGGLLRTNGFMARTNTQLWRWMKNVPNQVAPVVRECVDPLHVTCTYATLRTMEGATVWNMLDIQILHTRRSRLYDVRAAWALVWPRWSGKDWQSIVSNYCLLKGSWSLDSTTKPKQVQQEKHWCICTS